MRQKQAFNVHNQLDHINQRATLFNHSIFQLTFTQIDVLLPLTESVQSTDTSSSATSVASAAPISPQNEDDDPLLTNR